MASSVSNIRQAVKKIVRRLPVEPWRAPEEKEITYTPDHPQWEYAKFVFRSSLLSLVTLVDHLCSTHPDPDTDTNL